MRIGNIQPPRSLFPEKPIQKRRFTGRPREAIWTRAQPAALFERLRVKAMQVRRHEQAVPADQLAVKVHFAPAVFRRLDAHQIPVNGAPVAVGAFVVAAAGRKMEGSGDLLVKERILHGAGDVGIHPDGEMCIRDRQTTSTPAHGRSRRKGAASCASCTTCAPPQARATGSISCAKDACWRRARHRRS